MTFGLVAQMMVFVGVLAIVLTVVGLYGVIAYLTALDQRGIGIRMALEPPVQPCS